MEGEAAKSRSREEERERLLETGWEAKVRGGLVVWQCPDKRGSWCSQEVAMEPLEFLEEENKNREDDA